jgi:hypothetical protein
MVNIGLLLSHDEGFYAVHPYGAVEIFRHCLAAVLVSIAADVVYALNPGFGALFHYFPELPGDWLLAELSE